MAVPVGDRLERGPLELLLAIHPDDLHHGAHLDVWQRRHLLDQVLAHGGSQVRTADEHLDAPREPGEVHRRLPRRVAAADHRDIQVAVQHGLGGGGAVIDARPGQSSRVGDLKLAIADPGCDHHRLAGDLAAVTQRHDSVGVLPANAHHFDR